MNRSMLSRRAALVCGAGLLAAPSAAMAGGWCTDRDDYGVRLCSAISDTEERDEIRQSKPHWCWAACIQTVFFAHGYVVPQERIVKKIFGNLIDRPATGPEILSAINGRWRGEEEREFEAEGLVLWDRINSFERPDALKIAIRELDRGNPLIFATQRHTLVLTSMTYSESEDGRIGVQSLNVRDPWPEIPNRHRLAVSEVPRSGFLCGVHVEAA